MKLNPENPIGGSNPPIREWLDKADLLKMIPISRSTLNRWIKDGFFVRYNPTGKPLFKLQQVTEAMELNKGKPPKKKAVTKPKKKAAKKASRKKNE